MSSSLRVIKSSALLLLIQIFQRGLGIISTLVLARLLTPEHFGIVALIIIAIQFFELLIETGSQQYIIQKSTLSNDDLNTAFSLDVISKSAMALIITAISPLLADYFDTPELTLALSVSAIVLPIRSLKNPGMMLLAREINYRPLFRLSLWQKGLSFITVITLAIIHPSHWAIICGNLVSALIFTLGSYRVHSYRPKLTIKHIKQQWQFSQWLLLRGIVGFTRSQIDSLMVSRLFGTTNLGGYNLVRDISLLPALSIIIPISEPLLAAIAQGKNKATTLAYRTRVSLWLMITIITPFSIFIMAYPDLIGLVLLGPKWNEYLHLLTPFGLFFFSFCLFSLICDAMIAQGKVKLLFLLDVISTVIIIFVLSKTGYQSLLAMAWTRGSLAMFTTLAYLIILNKQVSFGFSRLVRLSTPVVIGCIAALLVSQLVSHISSNLFVEFIIRGFFYVLTAGLITVGLSAIFLKKTEEWSLLLYLFHATRKTLSRNSSLEK